MALPAKRLHICQVVAAAGANDCVERLGELCGMFGVFRINSTDSVTDGQLAKKFIVSKRTRLAERRVVQVIEPRGRSARVGAMYMPGQIDPQRQLGQTLGQRFADCGFDKVVVAKDAAAF